MNYIQDVGRPRQTCFAVGITHVQDEEIEPSVVYCRAWLVWLSLLRDSFLRLASSEITLNCLALDFPRPLNEADKTPCSTGRKQLDVEASFCRKNVQND